MAEMFNLDEGEKEEVANLIKFAGGQVVALTQMLANNDDYTGSIAKLTRKLYNGYVYEGFAPDEAMQLTIAYASSMGGKG